MGCNLITFPSKNLLSFLSVHFNGISVRQVEVKSNHSLSQIAVQTEEMEMYHILTKLVRKGSSELQHISKNLNQTNGQNAGLECISH